MRRVSILALNYTFWVQNRLGIWFSNSRVLQITEGSLKMQKWVFGLDNRALKNGKNLIFNSTRNSNLDFRCCIGFESSGFRRFYCLKFVDSSSWRLQRLELIFHEEKWPQRNFCCWKKSGTFYWYAMDWCRTSITGIYLLVFRLRRPCMQPLGGLPLARQPPGQAASGRAASTVDNI